MPFIPEMVSEIGLENLFIEIAPKKSKSKIFY
jgi:hypothetical protein